MDTPVAHIARSGGPHLSIAALTSDPRDASHSGPPGSSRSLEQLRRQLKMTQEQLAKASGIDQAEISRIERREINPAVLTITRLLHPLGARLS